MIIFCLLQNSSHDMVDSFEVITLASLKERGYESCSRYQKLLEELSYDRVAGMAELAEHGKRLQGNVVLGLSRRGDSG